jgi:hypothetical protein
LSAGAALAQTYRANPEIIVPIAIGARRTSRRAVARRC